MKLLVITTHFEFAEIVERVLDSNGVAHYNRFGMIEGKDRDGRHMGTQVHPGNMTVFHAQAMEDQIDPIFAELKRFREAKKAHRHLEALVLPIERRLNDE